MSKALGLSILFFFATTGLADVLPIESAAPLAPERPKELSIHGDVRQDPFFWLRDRNDPETIHYLNAENDYVKASMRPFAKLESRLLKVMKSHIKQSDSTYPAKDGAYLYFTREEKGKDYRVHLRTPVDQPKSEQIMLDENELAKGHDYMVIADLETSDDAKLMAYSIDTKGDRWFTIRFKDLSTGKMLDDTIEKTAGDFAWAADNRTLFYVKADPVTLRSRWIFRHRLGEAKDVEVYDEKDEKFDVDIRRSQSKRFVIIATGSKNTSEMLTIPASEPTAAPRVFQPRTKDVLYWIDDGVDRFYIRTNREAENFRLMECPIDATDVGHWKPTRPYDADAFLERFLVLKNHLVLVERKAGLRRFSVLDRATGAVREITFKEQDYSAGLDTNNEYDTSSFRMSYESMSTPESTIDVDLKTGNQIVRKVDEVPGKFSPSQYETARVFATAADGVKIPISLVFKKGLKKSAKTPLLLYGYGSYGSSMNSYFSTSRLALLEQGFVYAVAHPRGGSEMGRGWYLNGKLMKKKNTFGDFIAAAEYLIKEGWTSPEHLYAKGESAGGMLMGAIVNQRPELFHGVIASVPFVDVVTTMLDSSLPLTTEEYEEWGNPNEKAAYEYMKSYSPYDNVAAHPYPNLLVRAGLNDTQVGYWEPAKWVAKLRRTKTDGNLILFWTEMGAGHHGKSGRFSGLETIAREDAFLLRLEGKH